MILSKVWHLIASIFCDTLEKNIFKYQFGVDRSFCGAVILYLVLAKSLYLEMQLGDFFSFPDYNLIVSAKMKCVQWNRWAHLIVTNKDIILWYQCTLKKHFKFVFSTALQFLCWSVEIKHYNLESTSSLKTPLNFQCFSYSNKWLLKAVFDAFWYATLKLKSNYLWMLLPLPVNHLLEISRQVKTHW